MQNQLKSCLINVSLIEQNEKILLNKDIDFMNFYDVIIDIKSIKDIIKGWKVKMNEKAKKDYENFKNGRIIKIGVIGNSNKGKSFILSKISKINLPSGTSVRTEGLSIKYPELSEYKNRKLALLDSCGLETPILIEDKEKDIKEEKNEKELKEEKNEKELKEDKNKKELKEDKKELYEQEKQNANIEIIENIQVNEKEFFKIKSREKLITELFLQNYIIHNSDVLIIVVGILTYSEQKLLNRIKTEIQRERIGKQIFIVHNLMTYTSKEQVEDYIKNFY